MMAKKKDPKAVKPKKAKSPPKKQGLTPYSKKQVEGMIEDSMGSITQAAANLGVSFSTFYNWVKKYELQEYPDRIKKRVALIALDRAKYLAFTPNSILKKNGEKTSVTLLMDILNKWGKYIDYEEPTQKIEHSGGITVEKVTFAKTDGSKDNKTS